MADRLSLKTAILDSVFENVIDDARKFFGNDGAGDGFIGALENLLVEPSVFRIVLNGTDGHIGESDLEEFVAVLAA